MRLTAEAICARSALMGISMQEVFRFQRVGLTPDNKIIGHFTATGVRSHFSERFRMWGYDLPSNIFEPFAAE